MKKFIVLALAAGSISLCANDKELKQPLMELQGMPGSSSADFVEPVFVPKTFLQKYQTFLQKYPSSRQFAIYAAAALFHISALGMATQPCLSNGECDVVDSSLWLSLVPTLANLAGTGVSLWDERKALAHAEINRSNEQNA